MPRMLQPAGVSARPALIKPLPLNRTFRSPDPRPSPIKPPERRPYCNSPRLIKKGARQKKLERVPLYLCRACGRTFAPGPRAVRNKTYPINEIFEALTLYLRGKTLQQTAAKISSRHGHQVVPSTISRWLSEHPALTTYRRLRARGRRLFTPTQVIRAHKLYHAQVYDFAFHRAKLPGRRARRQARGDGRLDRALRHARKFPGVGSDRLSARSLPPRGRRSQLPARCSDRLHIHQRQRPARRYRTAEHGDRDGCAHSPLGRHELRAPSEAPTLHARQ